MNGIVDSPEVLHTPFPAASKAAQGTVNGCITDASSTFFTNKILITISQGGRLAQWVQVPLSSADPTRHEQFLPSGSEQDDLLPMSHLTPTTILGAGSSEREIMGHLVATQIASAISNKNPEESRLVVVGLGLEKISTRREDFFDLVDLVVKCI